MFSLEIRSPSNIHTHTHIYTLWIIEQRLLVNVVINKFLCFALRIERRWRLIALFLLYWISLGLVVQTN